MHQLVLHQTRGRGGIPRRWLRRSGGYRCAWSGGRLNAREGFHRISGMVTEVGMALNYRRLALVGGLLMLGASVWQGLAVFPGVMTHVQLHGWFLGTLVGLVLLLVVW